MRTHFPGCALALAAFGAVLAAPSTAQVLYVYKVNSANAVDLGTLGGDEAEATDINNSGAIVGWSKTGSSITKAFLYDSSMQIVGPTNPQVPSHARGVNDSNEVVGDFWDFFAAKDRPFYWHSSTGHVEISHNVYPGMGFDEDFLVYPSAINNYGGIVGRAIASPDQDLIFWDPCYSYLPVQWDYAYVNPQPLFCADQWDWPQIFARDVNNSGAIVGSEDGEEYRGYIWKDGVRTEVPGTANNADIRINGVNETNRVAGATAQGPIRAIYWNGMAAKSTNLGVLPGGNKSEAFEVNDGNFVAGYSTALVPGGSFADTVKSRAFIWHVEFGMYALPVPPTFMLMTTDCVANSLNNRETNFGLIRVVGYCTKNGKKRAVRWNVFVSKVAVPVGNL